MRKKTTEQTRVQKNQHAIYQAWHYRIGRTPLRALRDEVRYIECTGQADDPEMASLDPAKALVTLNPHIDRAVPEAEWAVVIAHLLLHLGFNHAARREERDPLLWNLACNRAIRRFLPMFRLGGDLTSASAEETEEEIYDRLSDDLRANQQNNIRPPKGYYQTYAGEGKPHIVGLGRQHLWNRRWEELLAEGIRQAVQEVIEETAERLGEPASAKSWGAAERAKKWVMNEFPLLGALAGQVAIIAKKDLCQRMDIHIAAVNGYLMEMYFNPEWNLSQGEVNFVYAHELLHVALMHHTRQLGRDHELWNIACDFVINGWLIEMGIGEVPRIGLLYDPRLNGMSSEAVYDLLVRDPKRCKGLRGFRGKLGDVLLETPARRLYRDDVTTLDDLIRRCMAAGLACTGPGRGLAPAGLIEEIRSLFTPPVPWDVELARWMDAHVPMLRDPVRTYARASRRQSSTPDIPRPARYIPQEWKEACTFGVVLDTSGSMDRELLGRALGAIASYAEARDVPAVRLVLCDAAPYDKGIVLPQELRGVFAVQGRGGTVLQPAIGHLLSRPDFPASAPLMIITDGWCEEESEVPREHCFLLPRKSWKQGNDMPLRTSAPIFRVLKEERYED